jgi:hypothetical protein
MLIQKMPLHDQVGVWCAMRAPRITLLSLCLPEHGIFNSSGRNSMNSKQYIYNNTCLKGEVGHPALSVRMVSKKQIPIELQHIKIKFMELDSP